MIDHEPFPYSQPIIFNPLKFAYQSQYIDIEKVFSLSKSERQIQFLCHIRQEVGMHNMEKEN